MTVRRRGNTLVVSRIGWAERLVARLSGADVTGAHLSATADEQSLAKFPPEFWNESQEANLFVLNRLKDEKWHAAIARGVARGADREKLDAYLAQNFVLTTGHHLAMLRLCLGTVDARPLRVVSDLPPAILRAFAPDAGTDVTFTSAWSWPLRVATACHDLGTLAARHALRAWRLLRLRALPERPADARPYVVWINALPAEVRYDDDRKATLTGFLAEARGDRACDVVIQGAAPARLPAGFFHRAALPALRFRPRAGQALHAAAGQLRQMLADIAHASDFRHRMFVAQATFDIPAFRVWFGADRPQAVLYPNHVIGHEPPVALLAGAPTSMMVFYSANVSYRPAPRVPRYAGAPSPLEPEIRFIIADCLTMWSPDMADAFRTAGYAPARLVDTGPIVFARAAGFAPTSRFLSGTRSRGASADETHPVRIGVFEVTPVNTQMRFVQGYGQLLYTPAYLEAFFADITAAARSAFGGNFVLVRKIKRALRSHHLDDPAIAHLDARLVTREPDDSLWRVLEDVDLVLCMPFTSVAYLADTYGIPAAYYDPSATAEPSPVGGRAAVVRGIHALEAWLKSPQRPSDGGGDERAIDAGKELFAAALGARTDAKRYHSVTRLERNVIHT